MAFALAVSYVLCPLAIKLAIGFYAEPLCALVLILGWKNLRVGKPIVGWALIGMAGLVRHEGLLIAVILCSVYMILKRSFKWKFFLLASGPGALWQLLMLVLGAHLQGYDFSQADPHPYLDSCVTVLILVAQFLIEAAMLCGIGGIVGIAFGTLGSMALSTLMFQMTIYPSPAVTIGSFSLSVVLGVIFGSYPAVKASKLQPVEALRAE